VCCRVLQCVAVCCSVLHFVATCVQVYSSVLQRNAVCCSLLQWAHRSPYLRNSSSKAEPLVFSLSFFLVDHVLLSPLTLHNSKSQAAQLTFSTFLFLWSQVALSADCAQQHIIRATADQQSHNSFPPPSPSFFPSVTGRPVR